MRTRMPPPADLDDGGWDPAWDVPEADERRPATGAPPTASWASFFSDCNTRAEAAMRSAGIDPKRCVCSRLFTRVSCRVHHPSANNSSRSDGSTPPQARPAGEQTRRQTGGRLAGGRAAALLGLRYACPVVSSSPGVCAVPGDLPSQGECPRPRRCVVRHHNSRRTAWRGPRACTVLCVCPLTRASDARADGSAPSVGACLFLHQRVLLQELVRPPSGSPWVW